MTGQYQANDRLRLNLFVGLGETRNKVIFLPWKIQSDRKFSFMLVKLQQ